MFPPSPLVERDILPSPAAVVQFINKYKASATGCKVGILERLVGCEVGILIIKWGFWL